MDRVSKLLRRIEDKGIDVVYINPDVDTYSLLGDGLKYVGGGKMSRIWLDRLKDALTEDGWSSGALSDGGITLVRTV